VAELLELEGASLLRPAPNVFWLIVFRSELTSYMTWLPDVVPSTS
jgi:hypothetical protein